MQGRHLDCCRAVGTFAFAAPEMLLGIDSGVKVGAVGTMQAICCVPTTALQSMTLNRLARQAVYDLLAMCAQCDIYSYGVILWEIVTGEAATRGRLYEPKVLDCRVVG